MCVVCGEMYQRPKYGQPGACNPVCTPCRKKVYVASRDAAQKGA
jgi:hypothetical protein